MAFYGYTGDSDRSYSTPYTTSYDYDYGPSPAQASSLQYSFPYEFGEHELTDYKSCYYRDDSFVAPSKLSYSIHTISEPKVIQYDPIEYHSSYSYYESELNPSEISYFQPKLLQHERPPYDRGHFPSETKFTISYSSVEFNEAEFEEYDPTPYDGGYDPVKTYGEPLPPSDATCYPRTVPQSDDTMSLENFQYSSIPSPYAKDDEPPNRSKPVETKTETETNVENKDKVGSDGKDVGTVGSDVVPSDGLENGHSPSYEHRNGLENGQGGDYGYERERLVPQIQYGSGLEAMDLCESLFGHWPCLAKMEQQRRNKCGFCDQEQRIDPWESAANYLFGSPIVYDQENYHHQHHPHYNHDQYSRLQ